MKIDDYVVAQVNNGKLCPTLGKLKICESYEEAVEVGVDWAKSQCDKSEEEIREELNNDADFFDPGGEWSICIGMPE